MKNTKTALSLIFVLALLLRVSFIVFYEDGKMLKNVNYADDEYIHCQIAKNFLDGKGFITDDGLYARRVPIYPLFLSLTFLIFRHSLVVVRLIQALIGALTCIVIFLLGKKIFNKKVGLTASLISAVYYPFIQQPAYLLNEVIFTFLVTISILFFLKYYHQRRLKNLFFASILFSIAILCRDILLYFSLFILIWLIILDRYRFKFIKSILIFLLTMILTVGIWSMRNYLIYKAFIPTTIGSGCTLYYGNNPKATGGTGGWYINGKDAFLPDNISGNVFTLENDNLLKKLAVDWIKTNPQRFVYLSFKKFMNMWRPFYSDARLINKIIMVSSYIPLVILGIIGIIKSRAFWKKLFLIYLLMAYYILAHMITIGVLRYRYPIMPFLIVFSAFAILSISPTKNINVKNK